MAWKSGPASSTSGSGEEWTGFTDQGVTMEARCRSQERFALTEMLKETFISETDFDSWRERQSRRPD